MDEKSERLYHLLEGASQEVKEWPEWERSDETDRERMAGSRGATGAEGGPRIERRVMVAHQRQ